jgi:AmmeMemoRadiSam system protein A
MSPQPEKALAAVALPAEYAPEERSILLRLAHRAIEAGLEGRNLDLTPPTPHLAELRGAFTSLHLGNELRGCVGYILPMYPLYRTIAETAQAAAFADTRFCPVTAHEAPYLEIQISVLSPTRPILAAEVEVGRHGLIVNYGAFRGLLLPQVPVEHGWDRETFLQQTCRKAGLPDDAWRQGAVLEAFTAEVFGEKD